MSTLFGWCETGHHSACRVQVSNDRGGLSCSCPCHVESPLKQGESGKLGPNKNEPPAAYLEVRDRGFSPTQGVD